MEKTWEVKEKEIREGIAQAIEDQIENNIDENRQVNNITKNDRLLIAEDDYDKYIYIYISQCVLNKKY